MGYAKRVDGTHAAIVKALRKVGCQVKDCSRVGQGFPDLVVRAPLYYYGMATERNARVVRILLMEVKRPKGKLTPDQETFIVAWPETVIVRSVSEALAAVGVR